MLSKIISTNKPLISIIANIQGITSTEQIHILLAITNIYQNNPFQITKQTKQQIQGEIIQIINPRSTITIGAISVGLHRLKLKGALIDYNGLLKLSEAYNGMDKVEQLVIRVK